MDRNLEALEGRPHSSWARLGLAGTGSVLIMVVVSLFISTYPSVGYRAGYAAAIAKGPEWADAEIDSADGTALHACDQLHIQRAHEPDVEYSEFVKGCNDGVDYLSGRHIPVLADGRT